MYTYIHVYIRIHIHICECVYICMYNAAGGVIHTRIYGVCCVEWAECMWVCILAIIFSYLYDNQPSTLLFGRSLVISTSWLSDYKVCIFVSHASSRMLYTERASRVHCVCNYPNLSEIADTGVLCAKWRRGPRESQSRRESDGRAVERARAGPSREWEREKDWERSTTWSLRRQLTAVLESCLCSYGAPFESASLVAFWYVIANVVRKCWLKDTHMCHTQEHTHMSVLWPVSICWAVL